MLIIHCYLIPRLTMSGGIPVLRLYAFMVWTGATLPFLQCTPYHDFNPSAHAVPNIVRLTRQMEPNYEACTSLYSGTVHRRLISQLPVIIWTRFTRMQNVKNAFMGKANPQVHSPNAGVMYTRTSKDSILLVYVAV